MAMNRKQVNAFLKIMSKDKMRPVLCSAYVDELDGKMVLVATDGYVLTAVYLGEEARDYLGKRVTRESVERWYKLADGKSRLTGETLQELMEDDQHNSREPSGNYPEWKRLMPTVADTDAFVRDMTISFNTDYVKMVQDLNGEDGVKMRLYGKLAPMVIESEVSLSVVMPMKEV